MTTVWMTVTVLKCRRLHFLCMPYIHFKSTNLHITVCGMLIECLSYWGYGQSPNIWLHPSTRFSHCKAMIDNMVHNSGPYFIWYSPMYLASSASSSVLPLSTMHPYSSSSSRLLTLIVSWMFIRFHDVLPLVLSSVYICFPIEGSWDAPLSYFRELVYHLLIYILFISESEDSPAQFMANLQEV